MVATVTNCINSHSALREQLVLEYLFNGNGFVYGQNNIKNFCDCEHYYGVLLTAPPPPHPIVFYFNGSDVGSYENDILKDEFAVICNKMNSGMIIFLFCNMTCTLVHDLVIV